VITTAPETVVVSSRGFADADSARRFGDLIAVTVRSISQYMSLERLDGITAAHDYDEALPQLERGVAAIGRSAAIPCNFGVSRLRRVPYVCVAAKVVYRLVHVNNASRISN